MYNRVFQIRQKVNKAWDRDFGMMVPFSIHYYNKRDLSNIIPVGISYKRGFTFVKGGKSYVQTDF